MCWTGNEDDSDIFKDFDDDLPESTPPKTCTAFTLSNNMKEVFCIAESEHKLFMGSWYSKANSRTIVRDTSRAHLYEIRNLN